MLWSLKRELNEWALRAVGSGLHSSLLVREGGKGTHRIEKICDISSFALCKIYLGQTFCMDYLCFQITVVEILQIKLDYDYFCILNSGN